MVKTKKKNTKIVAVDNDSVSINKQYGRNLKYDNLADLKTGIKKYVDDRNAKEKTLTMSSLAVALGLSRNTLVEYSKKDAFHDAIKEAKILVEASQEDHLLNGKNQVGSIFSLKNNFAWRDDKEVKITVQNIASITQGVQSEAIDGEIVDLDLLE